MIIAVTERGKKMNDTVYRQDAIAKLKERRKIFCKNRLDFTILPDKDKARVDEIDVCIAALINLPSAEPEKFYIANITLSEEQIRETVEKAKNEMKYQNVHVFPSAQQKPLKYSGDSICVYCKTADCDGCIYEPMEGVMNG